MKINSYHWSRSLSQALAVLIIVLIQLPTISLAYGLNNLTYSGLNLFSAYGKSYATAPSDSAVMAVFSNAGVITVADRAGAAQPPGIGSPYPSQITVSGMSGTISDVNVTINDLTAVRPRDLDFLLVGPGGQTLTFASDVGGLCAVTTVDITADDQAATLMPDSALPAPCTAVLVTGSYRPTNITSGTAGDTPDVFPAPAPAGAHNTPAPTGASTLNGIYTGLNPNGTWSLYVVDDGLGGGASTINGGWSIDITTIGGIEATNTGIVSNLNPSLVGQSVTFTSTTTNAVSGLPVTTGTVSFTQQGIAIAGCTGLAVNASGQAACATAALAEGTRTIQASYSGTATLGVSSANLSQVINSPTVPTGAQFCNNGGLTFPDSGTTAPVYPSTITTSNMFGTIATVTTSINGFTATRPSNIDLMLQGPNGVGFEFMSDVGNTVNAASNLNFVLSDAAATQLGTGVLASGTYRPTDEAIEVDTYPAPAPVPVAAFPAGSATFTNTFGGINPNGNWRLFALDDAPAGGTSTISGWCVTFTVTPFATTTTVTSSANPSVFGQPVTFTATVSSASGTPSGNVQFFDGATPIGGAIALNGSGQAQVTTSALSVGNHTISATYAGATLGVGGGGFGGSSGNLTGNPQVVNKANTTTGIVSSVNPSATGQAVTFTATVSPVAPGAGTRTGTVTISRNGQAICSNVAVNASGQAQCTMTFTIAFDYLITAAYSGDTNFNASSTVGPLTQQVLGPTAAPVGVSGRIVDQSGRGVFGARVTMQNQQGAVIWAVTNPFGYYRFADVPSGQTYFVSVDHKRFTFEPRTVAINEELVGLDFTAQP